MADESQPVCKQGPVIEIQEPGNLGCYCFAVTDLAGNQSEIQTRSFYVYDYKSIDAIKQLLNDARTLELNNNEFASIQKILEARQRLLRIKLPRKILKVSNSEMTHHLGNLYNTLLQVEREETSIASSISPNGDLILIGYRNKGEIINLKTGEVNYPEKFINADSRFSADGKYFISHSSNRFVDIFEVDGTFVSNFTVPGWGSTFIDIEFGNDSNSVYSLELAASNLLEFDLSGKVNTRYKLSGLLNPLGIFQDQVGKYVGI